MGAEEFYKQRSNSIRELWALSPKQIEYISLIMEQYAELRLGAVVGQSEQLKAFDELFSYAWNLAQYSEEYAKLNEIRDSF